MGAASRKESALERRQRELERESERIREQVKTLEKMAQRLIAEGATPGTSPRRPAPDAAPASTRLDPGDEPVRDDKEEVVWSEEEADEPADRPARGVSPDSTSRLADYLATGSFGKASRSISYERRIMRNKAIVMMVVALLAAFILYGLLR